MNKIRFLFLMLVAVASLTGVSIARTEYNKEYIRSLPGGFSQTLPAHLKKYNMTLDEYNRAVIKKTSDMSERELYILNALRDLQIRPTPDTLMQKIVSRANMKKYISGELRYPKGFISVCADVSVYETPCDFYCGLRLDYKDTVYTDNDESCAVIRFRAINASLALIPRSPDNGGFIKDPYPFGGAGFTTGFRGRAGTPEWYSKNYLILDDGAQLFEIFRDGREVLRGIYNAKEGRFFPCEK